MLDGEKSGIGGADGKHGLYEFMQTHIAYLQRTSIIMHGGMAGSHVREIASLCTVNFASKCCDKNSAWSTTENSYVMTQCSAILKLLTSVVVLKSW
jgi:hypothetical protein